MLPVEAVSETKTNNSTTSNQLWRPGGESEPLGSGFPASSYTNQVGKSFASPVTSLKPSEKMPSGIKHDLGKPPLDLLSTKALVEVARVLEFGKAKYSAHNWRGGLAFSRVIGAALRHITAFNDGQDVDTETGLSHIAHASCCLMFLLEYIQTHPELDDRYKKGE